MASPAQKPHLVLFPLMAQGHLIPMTDIAKLLAQNGAVVTLITTPLNADRVRATLARAVDSSSDVQIRVREVELPCEEVGLPRGAENLDLLSSLGLANEFYAAANSLREPVEKLFQELSPKPSCIISDMCLHYTSHVAETFGIPRISFSGSSSFCMCCLSSIERNKVYEVVSSEWERFVVPDLPHKIELTLDQLPASAAHGLDRFFERVGEVEMSSQGVIVNSFEELEGEYFESYKEQLGGNAWCIGPVSLCNKDQVDRFDRGNNQGGVSAAGGAECFEWLDSQEAGSVIYVCLGSLCNVSVSQLIELGLGLEATNRPFFWVIRDGENLLGFREWVTEYGLEERLKGRGFLLYGWAPQVVILSHPSVGGFLTHCGWNSTLEGVSAGLPMVTLPLFADQFCNGKFIMDVLKIGVTVGTTGRTIKWGEEEEIGVVVKKEDVRKAIKELMEGGEEAKERRKRAKELSKMAKLAMDEGGSSFVSIKSLIQHIIQLQEVFPK